MALVGMVSNNYVFTSVTNCCSVGNLFWTSGDSSQLGCCDLVSYGKKTNCYYLEGIQGTTGIEPKTGETLFYRTLEGLKIEEGAETPKTTTDVVDALNYYIAHPDSEVNTKGWCKWIVGDNGLPALDFNYEWDPTAGENGTGAFVKVNN